MQQGTLSNLLRVKDTGLELKEFDPDFTIHQWLLKAKTKRHNLSKATVTSSPVIHNQNDTIDEGEGEQEQEDDRMLPLLPHPVDESNDTVR